MVKIGDTGEYRDTRDTGDVTFACFVQDFRILGYSDIRNLGYSDIRTILSDDEKSSDEHNIRPKILES